jgi:hypothetical protein
MSEKDKPSPADVASNFDKEKAKFDNFGSRDTSLSNAVA